MVYTSDATSGHVLRTTNQSFTGGGSCVGAQCQVVIDELDIERSAVSHSVKWYEELSPYLTPLHDEESELLVVDVGVCGGVQRDVTRVRQRLAVDRHSRQTCRQ